MKIPRRMKPLVDEGLVDEILSQLKSGKEAQVYVVRCGDAIRCAKVYKEVHQRSFKQAVQYQEGRKVRGSRRARAMAQRTHYGQKEQETAWLHAEVDALYQLAAAGVRAPAPLGFVEGVLLMELIVDADGYPAPQLHELTLTSAQAREYELPRELWRLLSLREWSHEEAEQVFAGSTRAGSADGAGAPQRLSVAVVSH